MNKVFARQPYNYDMDAASLESGLECKDASLAKQSFAEEVDINTIVRRFGLSGELPTDIRMPVNGDFEGLFDFQSAMNMIVSARESFDAMPAHVRSRFDNDPHKFVEFCSKDENFDEAVKLGLVRDESVKARKEAAAEKARLELAAAVEKALEERASAPSTRST